MNGAEAYANAPRTILSVWFCVISQTARMWIMKWDWQDASGVSCPQNNCLHVRGENGGFYVTEENREAWQRFVENKIREVMKPETMELPEFKECVRYVEEEKRKREEYERREKELRIKHADERRRRSSMEKPKIAYIPKGLTVDYEKEYGRLIRQEVTFVPTVEDDFLYQLRFLERWYKKSVPQLIGLARPDAAYAVAVELCRQLPDFVFRRDIEGYLKPKKTRLRKLIEGAFSALVDSVKAWNNEEKRRWVNDFIFKQTRYYHDFRGLQKVMLQMMPSEPLIGEPVAVVREKSDEDLLLERKLIEECGKLQVPGRPRLYRSTKNFLRAFHLNSLEDLPEMRFWLQEASQKPVDIMKFFRKRISRTAQLFLHISLIVESLEQIFQAQQKIRKTGKNRKHI